MKTKLFSLLIAIAVLCFTSCDLVTELQKNESITKETFSGYVQKGPFVNGSAVTISELDKDLNQTGRSYSTTVAGNTGSFEQKKIELVSSYVQLKADGYYFNEVTGESSSGQLTLYALTDISEVNSANINVLTHLERSRVEYLVQQGGLTFATAKKQAQQEVLAIFSLAMPTDSTSESLNLSAIGDNNAMLLAISCILQGVLTTGDMSELMGNIIADIKTDGKLDNTSLGSALIDNARLIDLAKVRTNLQTKYTQLGMVDIVIPDFEKYVREFIAKTTYTPSKVITYPTNGSYGPNILSDSVTAIGAGSNNHCSMKANLPTGTSLKIIIKGGDWFYVALPAPTNWTVNAYNFTTKTQEFTVTESNKANDINMYFLAGNITIEYYENGATTPTRTKQLIVGTPAPVVDYIVYPTSGKSGLNILNDSVTVARSGKIYSIKAEVPKGKALRVVIKGGTWVCLTSPAPENWTVGNYDETTKSQQFTVTDSSKSNDMAITFTSAGTYTIEYYEDNAITPTRTRQFIRS
ncbi:MAG: hypothetical protein QM800_01830 [Paludibacter sp.]